MPLTMGPSWASSRLRRGLLGISITLLLTAAAWFIVLPAAVHAVATDSLAAAFGARIVLDSASWSLGRTVELRGLRVLHPDTGETIAEIVETQAEFADWPLWASRRLEAVVSRGVQAHLRKDLATLRPGTPLAVHERLRLRIEDAVVRVRPDPESDEIWSVPVESFAAEVRPDADTLFVEAIQARTCGGTVEGRGSLPAHGRGTVSLHLTFTGIDCAIPFESSRTWTGRVGGHASGSLHVHYAGGEIQGVARVEAERARLWALPVFRDLARELEVNVTPASRFGRCAVAVAFQGDRVICEELRAEGGDPMDVTGKGVFKLDGSGMYVELGPRILHAENVPLIGKPTQAITDLIGGVAVTVCMSGPLLAPKIEVKHGKPITDAFQGVLDLFK